MTEGKRSTIKPAISTFSDHILISFPLEAVRAELGPEEHMAAFAIMHQFARLLTRIAAAALRIGFLVRGGATIGKLYHAQGVAFGEALVDAFTIESQLSIYPRVVLSPQITCRPTWIENQAQVMRSEDGLYHIDYFRDLLLATTSPGNDFGANTKLWFTEVIEIVGGNLTALESKGKLNAFSKWAWFAHEFRSGLERMNPQILASLGISLETIPWPRHANRPPYSKASL